jgi:hypothetical protein
MSDVLLVAANTPGQVRGPKASLWPFPKRVHGLLTMLRRTRAKAAGALDVKAAALPVAVALNELSTRALPAWREHRARPGQADGLQRDRHPGTHHR